ncbi:MAG: choice-of-anchor Q domain-containing protein, partial [Lysobacterales bacterium]
ADLATSPNLTLTVIGSSNLVGSADPSVTLPPDTLNSDPLLLPLADNGGPTWTMALAPGSPAINAGNNAANLQYDQRGAGFARVYGPAADIGAYELQSTPDVIFVSGFDD